MKLYDFVRFLRFRHKFKKKSVSQLGQDLWVLYRTKGLQSKFFVDVGACYSIHLSNSYLLEKSGFEGLLIEPQPKLVSELRKNRISPVIECAIHISENLIELEIAQEPEFTTYSNNNKKHRLFRTTENRIVVKSFTLTEICKRNNVPKFFTYLSLDIEGNELGALHSLDFSRYSPLMISVEHNFSKEKSSIDDFMKSKGYIKDYLGFNSKWDTFYIKKQFLYESIRITRSNFRIHLLK